MEDIAGVLVPIVFFAMIFGIVYLVFSSRNRERMALIERGADPTLFESRKNGVVGGVMKIGLFFMGVGVGIVVAYFLISIGMKEEAAYPAMIFLFGGLALILSYVWQRKNQKEDQTTMS